jgi:hypothetical protein
MFSAARVSTFFPSPPPLRGRGQRPALLPAAGEGQLLARTQFAPLQNLVWRSLNKRLPLTLTLSPYAPKALGGEGMAACSHDSTLVERRR